MIDNTPIESDTGIGHDLTTLEITEPEPKLFTPIIPDTAIYSSDSDSSNDDNDDDSNSTINSNELQQLEDLRDHKTREDFHQMFEELRVPGQELDHQDQENLTPGEENNGNHKNKEKYIEVRETELTKTLKDIDSEDDFLTRNSENSKYDRNLQKFLKFDKLNEVDSKLADQYLRKVISESKESEKMEEFNDRRLKEFCNTDKVNYQFDELPVEEKEEECEQQTTKYINAPSEIWSSRRTNQFLSNKYIIFIGDQRVRRCCNMAKFCVLIKFCMIYLSNHS